MEFHLYPSYTPLSCGQGKLSFFFFLIPQLIALNFGAYEGRRHSNAAEKLKLPMQYVIGAQLPLYLLQNES